MEIASESFRERAKITKVFSVWAEQKSLFPLPARENLRSYLLFRILAVHPLYGKADKLSRGVIGAAIEVHRHKGSGLIESIYERCLLRE